MATTRNEHNTCCAALNARENIHMLNEKSRNQNLDTMILIMHTKMCKYNKIFAIIISELKNYG